MASRFKTDILKTIIVCVCVGGAAWVASSGNDGWGWLVFIAILGIFA